MAGKEENTIMDFINSLTEVRKNAISLLLRGMPEEAKNHLLTSYKERLLAMRSLIDTGISRLEEEKKSKKENPQKVDIE